MSLTPEQAVELVKKHGSTDKAAKKAGLARDPFRALVRKATAPQKAQQTSVKNLSEFREKYDRSYYVPRKIKAALQELGHGWEYELEFSRLAGVSLQDIAAVRDQFHEYVVAVERGGRRVWTGSKKTAEEMRKML